LAFASSLIFLGASGISVQADVVNSDTQGQSVVDVDDVQQKEVTPKEDSEATVIPSSSSIDEPKDTDEQASDVVSSNDSADEDQQPIEKTDANPEDSSVGNETQQTIIKDYNPGAKFVDNTDGYCQSGTDYTIPDEQIPDRIHQEGIFQSGMDGTATLLYN
jgi:hypothetical protein